MTELSCIKNRSPLYTIIAGLLISTYGCDKAFIHDRNAPVAPVSSFHRDTANEGSLFVAFVADFKVSDYATGGILIVSPGDVTLPNDVYVAALALKKKDWNQYAKTVCEYLMKYDEYYQKNFRQWYDLVSPEEIEHNTSTHYFKIRGDGNDPLFLLREFVEFSGIPLKVEAPLRSDHVWEWCKKRLQFFPCLSVSDIRCRCKWCNEGLKSSPISSNCLDMGVELQNHSPK